jgi:hypothetical protein
VITLRPFAVNCQIGDDLGVSHLPVAEDERRANSFSWFTQACVRSDLQADLRCVRMNLGAILCRGLGRAAGQGLETGDVATVREWLDVIDRIYALENAISPNWRTEGR